MAKRSGSAAPDFGHSERFDRLAHRIRVAVWSVVLPALIVAAFVWTAPGHEIPSTVLRAAIIYLFVLAVMRLAGKRTLAELTAFDLVVILIISEAIQPALTADDTRIVSSMLLVLTILAIDAALGIVKDKSPRAAQVIDDIPSVLIRDGVVNQSALDREKIDEDDIMEAARHQLGLESIDQVRFAILERTGGISIIPWARDATPRAR